MTVNDDTLDKILLQIGDIGKQQVIVSLCLGLIMLFHSATHIAYVFTSMDSDYRCLIPICEDQIAADPKWLRNAVPFTNPTEGKPSKCLMYQDTTNNSAASCSSSNFDRNTSIRCTSHFFYEDEHYIGREFNLLCEDKLWALSLVGTANTVGMFLGLFATGFISDRYGRKRLLLLGLSFCGVTGLIKTLSPSFYYFLVLELIEAIFSAGTCCCVFIMAVELVVPSRRALMGAIMNSTYSLGEVLVAVIAWYSRYWKSVIYWTYVPCALLILLYGILPESLRWTLSKGRIEEAKKALRKVAKTNKKDLCDDVLIKLNQVDKANPTSQKIVDIMRSKRLLFRFLNCCFGWITCAFLFYGITLNSVSLYGNKYLDFTLISLIEIPAYWSTNFMVDRIGRRTSICAAYFLTSFACICFVFSTKSSSWFYLLLYCTGKFGATAAFHMIYVVTSELFPTPLRHTVMGLCSTVGRLGSMTSPQTPLLSQIWVPLPIVMFATMSTAAGILSLFLPETKGIKLPDTIEEAEELK